MRKILGLAGTHGTGKSTILQGVKASGFDVSEAQLSRAAQAALGWDTLKRVEESEENMWALQEAILTALIERDSRIVELTLVERTPADLWAYTVAWCERLGINPQTHWRAKLYKERVKSACSSYDIFVIVRSHESIPFVEEPNRADLNSREVVAKTIDDFTWDMMIPTFNIYTVSKADRINEAVSIMKSRASEHDRRKSISGI